MIAKFVFFTVLIAFNAQGDLVRDGGVLAFWTQTKCNRHAAAFFKENKMPYLPCTKILKTRFDIIAAQKITFQWDEYAFIEDETTRLRDALKAIGKLHTSKSVESRLVRAIIRKALK